MRQNSSFTARPGRRWMRLCGQGLLMAACLVLNTTGVFKNRGFDGVARATTVITRPVPIKLSLSATPKRNNNGVIKAMEGMPISIQIKAINSNDPKGLDPSKVQSLTVGVSSSLPAGATFTSHLGEGSFSWTPQAGDAKTYDGKLLTFTANNTYTGANAPAQQVVLSLADNTAPSFSSTLPAHQNFDPGQKGSLDIIAIPGPGHAGNPAHRLKIVLDPSVRLPKGATLGGTRKGADGNWHRLLSWKPRANQVGLTGTLKFMADNADVDPRSAQASQAEYDVEYSVGGSSSSSGISAVTVGDASVNGNGSNWVLTAHGQVQTSGTLPGGLKVQINFGDGTKPISSQNHGAAVDPTGAWSYTATLDPSNSAAAGYRNLPCHIKAQLTYNGATVSSDAVAVTGSGAPPQCVDTPKCKAKTIWYPNLGPQDMAAMCM
ncbi:MAG: Ig domain-containing protein [Methylococcaceae bacterium]|nr:Ig domain-containing protein [Methylococcaceae bacterium]